MKKMKVWLASLVVLFVAATVLAACGGSTGNPSNSSGGNGSSDDQPEQVTITYSEWGTGDQLLLAQQMLDAFMDQYPHIQVTLEGKDWGTYWQSLTAAAAGGELADVYKMSYAYVENYAEIGIMKPLDDYIEQSGFNIGDIEDSLLGMHQYDGEQVSLPIDANVIMFFYNKDLFDDPQRNPKGVSYPSTNPTWDEVKELARALTVDRNGRTALDDGFNKNEVVQWGLSVNPSGQMDTVVEPALFSNGERMINEDGSLAMNTPGAQEVLNFFLDLTTAGINTNYPQVEAMGGDAGSTLAGGYVAMVVAGNWYTSIFNDAEINYGITHMPSFGGGPTTTVVQPAGVAVSAMTDKEEAALTLATWLAGPEGQRIRATQNAGLPANQQAIDTYVEAMGEESAIFFDAHQYGILSPYNQLKSELAFTLAPQMLQLPFDGNGDLNAALTEVEGMLN